MAPKADPQAGNRNLMQNVMFGGMSGVIGQSCVFPMYTIKTRLHLYPGRYQSVFHCARKILQHEQIRGLYRGLPPALLGVFPEKAIKLSMNDYLTALLARPDGSISVPMAILAGGGAGLSQVVITNPMELVMINTQNNAAKGRKNKGMFRMARELGLSGLYKGVPATLLRDIPFSMMFFSLNMYLREQLRNEDGKLPISHVFLAGILSGSSASGLSTPFDVIKTRLQAEASETLKTTRHPAVAAQVTSSSSRSFATVAPPSVRYTGIMQCARHIYATEGMAGFWAGVVPRMLIISPLFGITLFFYDVQRRLQESGRL